MLLLLFATASFGTDQKNGSDVLFKLEADFAKAVAENGHAAFVSYFAEDGVELDDGGGITTRTEIGKQPFLLLVNKVDLRSEWEIPDSTWDELKIDKGFVHRAWTDETVRAIKVATRFILRGVGLIVVDVATILAGASCIQLVRTQRTADIVLGL